MKIRELLREEQDGFNLDGGYTAIRNRDNSLEFSYTIHNKDGKEVGHFTFSHPVKFENGKYHPIRSIYVEPSERRKGLYRSVIENFLKQTKRLGSDGIISFPVDDDTGEFERAPEATNFWYNNPEAVQIETDNGDVYLLNN